MQPQIDNGKAIASKRLGLGLAVLSLLLVSAQSSAVVVTKFGTDVSFTFDDSTLFGDGTVVGNDIFFTPDDFKAQSNGAGFAFENDTLDVEININPGSPLFVMDAVMVNEFGDYSLGGSNGSAYASASLRTDVFSLTDLSFSTETVNTGTISSPQDLTFNDWSLINTNDWAWDEQVGISLTVQNNLIAYADEGDFAFIQKKAVPIQISVMAEIPVPAAVWLFGSALAGLGFARKTKRQALKA